MAGLLRINLVLKIGPLRIGPNSLMRAVRNGTDNHWIGRSSRKSLPESRYVSLQPPGAMRDGKAGRLDSAVMPSESVPPKLQGLSGSWGMTMCEPVMIYDIVRFANMAASMERRTLPLPQDFQDAHPNDQKTRARWVIDILHAFPFEEQSAQLYCTYWLYLIFLESSCFIVMLGELGTISCTPNINLDSNQFIPCFQMIDTYV